MRNLIVLVLLSIASLQAFSRTFPGYYLTNNGDSVRCEFRFKDWSVTPGSIDVIASDKNLTLAPTDTKGFGIDGYSTFVSRAVSYHPGNYSSLNAPDVFSDHVTTKHSFLRVVADGKYALYELAETSHTYFFVEHGGAVKELLYRVKKTGMNIEEDNTFRKEIFAYFSNEKIAAENSADISNSTYNGRSIVPLFRRLNEKVSGIRYRTVRPDKTALDLFIGAVDNRFPTAIGGRYTGPVNQFGGSTSASGGVAFVYFASRNFNRFAVGASLGYNQYSSQLINNDSIVDFVSVNNHRTTKYQEELTFKNRVLMADLYGMYFVNPLNRVKVYLKAGVNTNIAMSPTRITVDYNSSTTGVRNGNVPVSGYEEGRDEIELRKLYFNIHGGLGLNSGNHKIEFNYYTPGVLNVDLLFKAKMMSVYYYYTLSR